MKVKISDVKKLLENILIKNNVSKKETQIIVEEYLEGELQGKFSHGLTAFPSIIKKLRRPFKKPKILKKTHSLISVNANYNFGAVLGRQLADEAIKMASKESVGLILIRNMTTWLRPGTLARYIAQKGYIAFIVNNGGKPMVAPSGGYDPVLATNPIGIGIPTSKESIVADMATSVRAWGEVRIAKANNKKLPQNAFLNNKGNITTNPDKAYSALPFGDYKGFALGMFIEILTGSLVDMPMSSSLKGDYRTSARGAFMLIVNPKMSTSLNKFKKDNTKLIKDIKNSKKRKGVKVILIPGERGFNKRKENLKNGYLDIQEELWDKLNSLNS